MPSRARHGTEVFFYHVQPPTLGKPRYTPIPSWSCGLAASQGRGKHTVMAGNQCCRKKPWSCRPLPSHSPCYPRRLLLGLRQGERASFSRCEANPGPTGLGENWNAPLPIPPP